MPQMAPISWMILFIFFSFSFIMFNILNYFNFNKLQNQLISEAKSTLKKNSLNWKW